MQENVESTPEKVTDEQEAALVIEKQADDDALDPRIQRAVERVASNVSYAVIREAHAGPMPAPKQLAEYERVLPGLAAEIRDEFLANGSHVRAMEQEALHAVKSDSTQNRKVAERLVWGALIASTILALTGHDGVAATIAVSTVGAVITGFLRRKSAESGSDKDGSE